MEKETGIIALLLLYLTELARSDGFYSPMNREDPCINLCEKTTLFLTNGKYVKSCCQRGCRFFNLVDLCYGLEPNSLNDTKDECEASCTEAYKEPEHHYACSTGCDFMAKQRISDLLRLYSAALLIEEGVDSSSKFDKNFFQNILIPDIPENDILSDPGLRKELNPRWWDSNGFKLPQTYIKTVPLDAGTVDYGLPSDSSLETERSKGVWCQTSGNTWVGIPRSDLLQCTSRYTGIPHLFLVSAIITAALSAFWVCLCSKKENNSYKEIHIKKPNILPEMTLYVPDEAPLHKKPPPKYVDVAEFNYGDKVINKSSMYHT